MATKSTEEQSEEPEEQSEEPEEQDSVHEPAPIHLELEFPDLGAPEVSRHDELRFKQWAKDGGAVVSESAPAGQTFLVATFPSAQTTSYVSTDYSLHVDDSTQPVSPYAVTPGGGFETFGGGIYQKEVGVSTHQSKPDVPFAVVFLVPRDAKVAILEIDGTNVQILGH